ncbi:Scn8a [Symbiodinium natans]|uniref:Scn8a protein n=1 Tax=Symbiodinium natans TaxID=878477 RepID=A0A812IBB0_9DINO|nr:Scn8a [Symbiodinium natans]
MPKALPEVRNMTISSRLASVSEKDAEDSPRHEPSPQAITQAAEELQIELSSMLQGKPYEPTADDNSWMGRLRHGLATPEYELAITLLIFLNTMVIGLQFQYEGFQIAHALGFPGYGTSADELWPGIPTAFDVLNLVFTLLFFADVLLRGSLFWKTFFCDWFNWLDMTVVLTSIVDLITAEMFNTSVLRLLRLTKLSRSIRVLKFSNVLDSLTMIMKCLRASVGTLFWSLCVLLVIQCIGAILIMFMVQTYLRNPNELSEDNRLAVFAYYGTFSRAMLTMFEVLLANWIPPCRILVDNVSEYFSAVFILYRCLVGFAVLNVIQAVFIQRTMQVAQDDKELQLKQKQYAAETFERKLRYIFEELDTSGDGIVTWEEFDEQLKDPRTGALLSMIEIDTQDLRVFYDLLDDGDGRVNAQQFARGVLAMKGPAKSIDLARVSKNLNQLGRMVHQLTISLGAGMPISKGLSDFYSRA